MRVLVTYGWCRTAYAICRSLARAGFRVSACGDSALCMTRVSRYVDTFDRVPNPFERPREYAAAVGRIVRERGIDLVMPAHEDFVALQEFPRLLPPEVPVAAPPSREGLEALDKWSLLQRAIAADVPVPETFAPQSLDEAERILRRIELPAIVKPHRGNGGKGVRKVSNSAQAVAEYRRLTLEFGLEHPELPLIQQHISGIPMGSCFIAVDGRIQACFVERYLRSKQAGFGTSVLRERATSVEIENSTSRLCRELRWTGVGHLDFIVGGPEHKAYLLEMNPRFWGALNLSIENGFDFPLALVSLATTGAVDAAAFVPRSPVRSLWIAGELMACVDDVRRGRWPAALRSPVRFLRSERYDDFQLTDPLPLALELAYYLAGFIRTRGDINPASLSMINRKKETICDPASN